MRLSSRRLTRGTEIELSMTSMIDVVFLLLIFFMTTSSFVKTERNLNSGITLQDESASGTSDLEPAIVDVVPGGGQFVYRIGEREMTSASELTDILRQFPDKLDGAFVRVSDGAPFQMTAAAIQACKSAGFTIVSYVPLD